jgi:ATP-dependent 26S proteasome regulatory subunit
MFDISNMILMSYLSKIDLGQGIFTYEILTLILVMGLLNFVKDKVTNIIPRGFNYLINKIKPKHTTIDIVGWEFLNNGLYTFEYPHNMTSINYYIYANNKSKNFRYFNSKRNGVYYSDEMKDVVDNDSSPNYILGDVYNIQVDDDIYISVYTEDIHTEKTTSENKSALNWKITMSIKSYKHDSVFVQNFISRCILEYEKYTSSKSKNKTYHFIYQGKNSGKLVFSTKIISDFSNPDNQNYESFDTIHHSNKEMLIKDIKRLHDTDYYKRTGLKRKKGYLFYGKPGTGKTATVMGMSDFDKRHIIEVPLSRVKTNNELEAILTLTHINNIKFSPHNIIILFDELDIGTKLNRTQPYKKPNISKDSDEIIAESEEKNNNFGRFSNNFENDDTVQVDICKDKLSLDTLLSRFDGIGNYAGLIIIGTTNNIDNIDRALYRDGRLSLVEFDYASFDDIVNIIKQYYQTDKIDSKILDRIKLLDKHISHAKLRYKLEHYDNINDLISYLETISIPEQIKSPKKPLIIYDNNSITTISSNGSIKQSMLETSEDESNPDAESDAESDEESNAESNAIIYTNN